MCRATLDWRVNTSVEVARAAYAMAMKLEEALQRSPFLEVVCATPSCGARTHVEARFFLGRRPPETSLSDLAASLICTACGADRVVVGIHTAE
jgi:hypothetical protein